jgi:catechol 2,3-dioxygenase-like lactoylglutathione lyase family enzyme
VAFRVDNIQAMAARLRAAGVTLFSEPVRVPAGVVKFAAGDKSLLYFLDPDGVILELAEYG